jgi:hypothetical protein
MEQDILDKSSAFYGQKLDDAYFKIMTSTGLKVGLCLRPQVFTLASNGSATQVYLGSNAAIIANLESKARYTNARWGATLFYVDSTVDTNGGTLDPAIFKQLITDLPGFLFIPEESTPRYYAYTAPFYSFIFHTTTGTPACTYSYYPHAFGANLVNDVSASTLAQYQPQLTAAVEKGDILMAHADYWQQNNPTIVAIYQAAAGSAPAPVKSAPRLTWPTPAAIPHGTPLSATQLDATANVPGTFVYNPPTGTVLNPGTDTLLATFTPVDSAAYTTQTATVPLTVNPPPPTATSPLSITYPASASTLSGQIDVTAQCTLALDAAGTYLMVDSAEIGTRRVTGAPYLYPLDTTTLTNGTHSLQLWGHDINNTTTLSPVVTISVLN